ncbi:hypothetical protein TNCT_469831 [Trichonephila clavata]|uniref:Uncharacterized protein n=1 Tax=Trichonephila clavata TaxID=2740835 RepID=A0A8X6LLF6_TRICU|nr:hypothetical protein TNCT_469831 [Trichonephila clavata]
MPPKSVPFKLFRVTHICHAIAILVLLKKERVCKPLVPEEIAEMIVEARHVQPFNVVMIKEEDFYDISAQCDTFLNTSPIKISTPSWTKISRANLPIIQVKTAFSQ